jgi:hypothetical protein
VLKKLGVVKNSFWIVFLVDLLKIENKTSILSSYICDVNAKIGRILIRV